MNQLISQGATNTQLFDVFNRSDVSRQAKGILKEKYFKLSSLDEFNRKQLEINSASKEDEQGLRFDRHSFDTAIC